MASIPLPLLLLLACLSIHSEAHSPKYACEWLGTAPFCRGECEFPWKEFRKAKTVDVESPNSSNKNEYGNSIEFGWACWVGKKTLCCKENFDEVPQEQP